MTSSHEVIIERLKDKQTLFKTLESAMPTTYHYRLATPPDFVMSDIGVDVKRQDKIGLTHYFAPPHIVPGVEVAKGPGTSDETYNIIYDLMKKG